MQPPLQLSKTDTSSVATVLGRLRKASAGGTLDSSAGAKGGDFVDRWWPRVVIVVAVLTIHTAVLTDVFLRHSRNSGRGIEAEVFATAEIIGRDGVLDKVPAPDVQLETVPVGLAGGLH
jgi:hypothetical protein